MTQPVEDVEKLARELAEALESSMWCYSTRPGHIAIHRDHAENEMLVILRTHCAARDAELQRLREAAERCVKEVKKEIYMPPELGFAVLKTPPCIEALKAALQSNPQEPSE